MSNSYFQFRQFRIHQEKSGMKVTTDACLFGAWVAGHVRQLPKEPTNTLDIGTGTGLLSLMLAQVTGTSQIDALEINKEGYQEAKANFASSPWANRLTAHHTALQSFQSPKRYDLIICNPPFFLGSQKAADTNKNQARHAEDLPQEALLNSVLRWMHPRGSFFLLYPEREMLLFARQAQQQDLAATQTCEVLHRPTGAVFRRMCAFRFSGDRQDQERITIRNSDGRYTDMFWSLLKDYYLEYNDPHFDDA